MHDKLQNTLDMHQPQDILGGPGVLRLQQLERLK